MFNSDIPVLLWEGFSGDMLGPVPCILPSFSLVFSYESGNDDVWMTPYYPDYFLVYETPISSKDSTLPRGSVLFRPLVTEFDPRCFLRSANRYWNSSFWFNISFLTVLSACFYSSNCYSISFLTVPVFFSSSYLFARVIYMLFLSFLRSNAVNVGG